MPDLIARSHGRSPRRSRYREQGTNNRIGGLGVASIEVRSYASCCHFYLASHFQGTIPLRENIVIISFLRSKTNGQILFSQNNATKLHVLPSHIVITTLDALWKREVTLECHQAPRQGRYKRPRPAAVGRDSRFSATRRPRVSYCGRTLRRQATKTNPASRRSYP